MASSKCSADGEKNNLMADKEAASSMEDNNDRSKNIKMGPPTQSHLQILDEILAKAENELFSNSRSLSRRSSSKSSHKTEVHDDTSIAIGADLYSHIISGNKDSISRMETNLWEFKSIEDGNSILHIAAMAGQAELIVDILPQCKNLIMSKNTKKDLPFHSAAKAGHLNAIKALTNWENYHEKIGNDILGTLNEQGDTPLHLAVRNNQQDMACHLFHEYSQACYQLNDDNVCPLFLAIEARYWGLANEMISFTKDKTAAEEALLHGKSVVHAAIVAKNVEILKEILKSNGKLIESFDDKHRTPLSYAAFIGYVEGVKYLLQEFPSCAFKCDRDGSFPVHKASSGGNVDVIKMFNRSKGLLNRKAQNILHVAAGSGKSEVVSCLLKVEELERLINLKDEDGNTPLHLAAKGFHPRVVYILSRDKSINLELKNNEGLTALDVVEIHAGSTSTFEERLTWLALRYVDAPRSSQETRKDFVQKTKLEKEGQESTRKRKVTKRSIEKEEMENFKDRIDTHLLVATLVATVTFAAGFTLPGGYNQSEPHIGMATLAHKWAFQAFVISNTAAMYSSIMAVVTLIWAQLGELKLSVASLKFALPVLGFALSMMSLAFMMGIFVALKNLPWLSYVALGMGSISLIVVLVLFIPQYNPSYIRNPILRFFFSVPLRLLIIVCEKGKPTHT